jgi:hypothetical protein
VRPQANPHSFSPREFITQYETKGEVWAKTRALIKLPEPAPITEEAKFKRLAEKWMKETAHEPSLAKKSMHPSYQRIMAMGPSIIPSILKEMKKRPGHWFWALEFLIQDEPNPAVGCDSLKDARTAWLKWGESKGFL